MKAKPVPLAVYIKKAELYVIISKISEKDYVIKFILKTAVWKRCGDWESGVWISEGNDAVVRNVGRIQTIESCQESIVVGLQALVVRIMGFETLKKTRNPFNFPKNSDSELDLPMIAKIMIPAKREVEQLVIATKIASRVQLLLAGL